MRGRGGKGEAWLNFESRHWGCFRRFEIQILGVLQEGKH
jgi:hypothetical protein